jgi:uncharacterized protein
METERIAFDESHVLHELKHYLPAQAPLKDFVHHNTLHAFQHLRFHDGLEQASALFGYKVYLSLEEYRALYQSQKISRAALEWVIAEQKGADVAEQWESKLLHEPYDTTLSAIVGLLRSKWKDLYKINLDKEVHPLVFRLARSYLDQGIAIWKFPVRGKGFLSSVRTLERHSFISLFKRPRARRLLLDTRCGIKQLLDILVGEESYYEQYLFDQQFAHPGWSGMAAVLESKPEALLDRRAMSLHDFIVLELLLEIDVLDAKFGESWPPLAQKLDASIPPLFASLKRREVFEVYALWQEAMEWTYYDQALRGMQMSNNDQDADVGQDSFQALFCIDDRSCSLRRYVEQFAPGSQTFGTAGFFNLAFYFQPEHGKFYTKACPAPVQPEHLIKEYEARKRHDKERHFSKHTSGIVGGWLISQTMGFWSALKMARSIFMPTETPFMVSSFQHIDPTGKLQVECKQPERHPHGLQLGFTVAEMAERIEGLLRSIGLVRGFAPIVYLVGHGASSVNNTYYAGYDCGACSGRAGSPNARAAAYMANHPEVRALLQERGIDIPANTQFLGALHDTTRDEIAFYDEDKLNAKNTRLHQDNAMVFGKALAYNAKERARRFWLMDIKDDARRIHEKVKLRSLSLFEPRPEWNHATNALCIVGRRATNKHLFLDRRAFLNSYDYRTDPDGRHLLSIMKAVAPVCGGINLEYYFSRVDNYRLGAGTKLPHNVVGLIGLANGVEGDLRPGLPRQMVNIHDPLRLLVMVEHFPEALLEVIRQDEPTYEWFKHGWIHLVAIQPESKEIFYFTDDRFIPYRPFTRELEVAEGLEAIIESSGSNLPVYRLKRS